MILTIASTKGGTGKTTTAVYLATGLAIQGDSVLLVDADEQGSALAWSDKVDLMFPVISVASRQLERDVRTHYKNYDHVVIDCPPGQLGTIARAIRVADDVVVPVQPTGADLDKLMEIVDLVRERQDVSETGLPDMHILLTRAQANTNALRDARNLIGNESLPLLRAEIFSRTKIAVAFGSEITPDDDGMQMYLPALEEIQSWANGREEDDFFQKNKALQEKNESARFDRKASTT